MTNRVSAGLVGLLCWVIFDPIIVLGREMSNNGLIQANVYESVCNALSKQDISGLWPQEVLPLAQLLTDNSELVRHEVYLAIADHVRKMNGDAPRRRELVGLLVKGLTDQSSAIRDSITEWLCTMKPDDFGPDAKIAIEKAFNLKPTKQLILLSGLADVTTVSTKIDKFVFYPSATPSCGRFYGTVEWGAELVRARKGNRSSIKKVLEAVDAENDTVTRVTLLLPELEYVHQPEVVVRLKHILNSEERLEPL